MPVIPAMITNPDKTRKDPSDIPHLLKKGAGETREIPPRFSGRRVGVLLVVTVHYQQHFWRD
jgi:hypothetical protein